MAPTMTTMFKYDHCVAWMYPSDATEWPTEVKRYTDGEIYCVRHPFGNHITITAFGGENIYTIMVSGGHEENAVAIVQRCDSPIKIHQCQSSDEALKFLLDAMPHADGQLSLRAVVANLFKEWGWTLAA